MTAPPEPPSTRLPTTPWGEDLDPDAVLQEYPRPALVRDSYLNLNGSWDYAIRPADQSRPDRWDGTILVPFSPEAPLSGVGRRLEPGEALWYRRDLSLPAGFVDDGGVLVHFGAVDQSCEVYVDDTLVGRHDGGYLPFSCPLPPLVEGTTHELVVRVTDETDRGWRSRGKQSLRPGGIWYTAQSGIWQTVWLESVPATWISAVRIDPAPTAGELAVSVEAAGDLTRGWSGGIEVLADGVLVGAGRLEGPGPVRVPLSDVRLWTPERPFLYDVRLRLETGESVDEVTSYAALRSVAVGSDGRGRPRLLLNGEPYLQAGLLDQGYWPDGLYTAPSDEALIHDIASAKQMGFTMLRKHIKIEPQRWYHHCDRLGMLVWQDLVNGGLPHRSFVVVKVPVVIPLSIDDRRYRLFGRDDDASRATYRHELEATVRHLRHHPSIVCWVAFNEGWGQFDANTAAARLLELDPTRIVDHASGWHDQGGGDLVSRHVYFRPFRIRGRDRRSTRAIVLSEYGGHSYRVPGHVWSDREYGYGRHTDAASFARAFARLQSGQVRRAIAAGLSAFCYTQLSDVEEETNGLLTYDRRVTKIDPEQVAGINRLLQEAFTSSVADRT